MKLVDIPQLPLEMAIVELTSEIVAMNIYWEIRLMVGTMRISESVMPGSNPSLPVIANFKK